MNDLIPVNSPVFEYVYVSIQRCPCGGYFVAQRQELLTGPTGPVDRLIARCRKCGAEQGFDFDIRSFFGQPEKYDRFRRTDSLFRQAMEHVRAGRMAQAEADLRQVVDPQEGEPALAWGHFHLGMTLLVQSRADEALVHLERAAALQPLEPEIRRRLGYACQAAGRHTEAAEHIRQGCRFRLVGAGG